MHSNSSRRSFSLSQRRPPFLLWLWPQYALLRHAGHQVPVLVPEPALRVRPAESRDDRLPLAEVPVAEIDIRREEPQGKVQRRAGPSVIEPQLLVPQREERQPAVH